MIATQRARLHLLSRIEQAKNDIEWLEELWERQPQTNERYPFGLNRHYIAMEKLTGLTQEECNKLTKAMINLVDTEEIKNLLTSKLQ